MLTKAGPSPGHTALPALQTDHSTLEGSGRPGGRRHLRTHVGVRARIGAADGAHQGAAVLVRPGAVSEDQRALVGGVAAGVAADWRAVRVGQAVVRVRAAGRERGAVRGGLRPAVVPAEAVVRLVGRVARLQVGQGGQHGRDPGGGDVDRGAGRGVDVIPGVVRVRGLVGGQGQALIHLHRVYVLSGIWKKCIWKIFLDLILVPWR